MCCTKMSIVFMYLIHHVTTANVSHNSTDPMKHKPCTANIQKLYCYIPGNRVCHHYHKKHISKVTYVKIIK